MTVIEGVPPGPRWPRALQTAWWAARPMTLLDRCRRRYGDLFTLRVYGFGNMVFVADPAAIKQSFTGDRDVFHAGEANAAMGPVLGEHSLLLLDGERHLRERKLLLPPFHGESVRTYAERVGELAAREAEGWPVGEPFAVRPRMQEVTLEVILQAVMGVRDEARLERLRTLLPKLLDFSLSDMWAVWLFPKVMGTPLATRHKSMRVRPEVDRLLFEEIAAHREDPEGRDDVLALLLRARGEDGEPLSDAALRDHLVTLLLAGHETTTTGLAWAFERLVRHPDVLERLVASLADEDESYLEAVVNETLRVRPVIDGVWRKLTAPAEIAGHALPAGTIVFPTISLVQRDGRFWDDPEAFRPERWLGDDGKAQPYTSIPFGGGPRRCVGASFALMEMRAVLRAVLERVELRPQPGVRGEAARVHHVTHVPARGGQIVVERRVTPGA